MDTCVWVSAIRSRQGAGYALLSLVPDEVFRFGVSVALFLEYKAKLIGAVTAGESPLLLAQVDAVLFALAHYAVEVPVYYRLRPNLKDENDNMVFECAANFGAEAIITHNVKDFCSPELRGYGLSPITPGDFLMQIREGVK